ncbi:NirA family protein [Zavarzinella formosa]|uniref:NirA family protein n=1 Tax=Zavarzinella formosa TaxID=360055 RepID=UPI0003177C09|nr:NirA family protein [Zavarzinella formosa]
MSGDEFNDEQKQYLQGFVSGAELTRAARGLPTFAATLGLADANGKPAPAEAVPAGPDAVHFLAQNRTIAEGKKLNPQEEAKRKRHPLDMWDDVVRHSAEDKFPKGDDVLSFKYHGLFFVAPAQDSYMCRLRMPGGLLTTHQFRGIAKIAEECGGGYADATTRSNLQIREIPANRGEEVITSLQDLGIQARGSGADNIRNVTGSPTAGIDPHELIDTRPYARAMHYHILHHREMYGLPRKFNIAFDGGGAVSALEDTNDIGFTAVRVAEGKSVPAGVYFRLQLGGISGHKDFAKDEGVLLTPDQCVPVAAAIVRVFNENGDRTDRKKARLKYVLDRWGHEKYVTETEKHLPFKFVRFPLAECEARPAVDKHGHLGVHPQKQPGLFYVGVLLPVGRMNVEQMRGLADLADKFGSGTIRMTVWQNLLISDVKGEDITALQQGIEELGLHWKATGARGGLVACTGNAGCKFAASNTKRHALAVADHLDGCVELDQPVNIHLTGCPNSCAQHYLGDIGMLGAKVAVGDDMVEGYHVYVGGGYGDDQHIGRELYRSVLADELPFVIEGMLRGYMARRLGSAETFNEFVRRQSAEQLKLVFEQSQLVTA